MGIEKGLVRGSRNPIPAKDLEGPYGPQVVCLPYHANRNETQEIRPLLVGRISVYQQAKGDWPSAQDRADRLLAAGPARLSAQYLPERE